MPPVTGRHAWGEEFLIVLPETGYEGAIVAAEKIRAVMSATPFMTRAGDVAVTSSFGVAATEAQGPEMGSRGKR